MTSGFFALLDDIAAISKAAAASLDDVAVQAIKAGKKTAGIVIDDAAVTPRYVVGFAAERELPIIAKIAWGSIKNKLLYLLPAALLLTTFAPWAITPLLMAGGLFLCFEGYEKVHQLMHPPAAEAGAAAPDTSLSEEEKVASAIRTDFILSAEIMAITLAAVEAPTIWMQAFALVLVAVVVTGAVYGAVALIVKADDFGVYLAQAGHRDWARAFGNWLVHFMPSLLKTLSLIGMAAMLWVGGGIILHGLEQYGLAALARLIHAAANAVGSIFGPLSGVMAWLIDAMAAGVIGLFLGWLTAIAVEKLGFGGGH